MSLTFGSHFIFLLWSPTHFRGVIQHLLARQESHITDCYHFKFAPFHEVVDRRASDATQTCSLCLRNQIFRSHLAAFSPSYFEPLKPKATQHRQLERAIILTPSRSFHQQCPAASSQPQLSRKIVSDSRRCAMWRCGDVRIAAFLHNRRGWVIVASNYCALFCLEGSFLTVTTNAPLLPSL